MGAHANAFTLSFIGRPTRFYFPTREQQPPSAFCRFLGTRVSPVMSPSKVAGLPSANFGFIAFSSNCSRRESRPQARRPLSKWFGVTSIDNRSIVTHARVPRHPTPYMYEPRRGHRAGSNLLRGGTSYGKR